MESNTAVTDVGPGASTASPPTGEIVDLRDRIDQIDQAIIDLCRERTAASRNVGDLRLASGGTRHVLAVEHQILDRYRTALGEDGVQLALLLLRAGRAMPPVRPQAG